MSLTGFKYGIFLLVLVALLPEAGPALARDAVPDKVSGEVVLEGDLALPGVVRVEAGAVLILEAGSRITASPGAAIEVRGKLQIKGTAQKPVIISSEGKETWGGSLSSRALKARFSTWRLLAQKLGSG